MMPRATTQPDRRIDTARLRLRPMVEGDIDDVVAGIGDYAVSSMLARVPHPYRRSDALTFLEAAALSRDKDLTLVVALGGKVVGGVGISGIRTEREFGYWLGRAHWGKGFATEVGTAFLAYAFGSFGLDIVRSGVFVDNPQSLRVQEKLGFEAIGTRFVHCLARGGKVAHTDTILTRQRFLDLRS